MKTVKLRIKNQQVEKNLFRQRLYVVIGLMAILSFALLLRLVILQVFQEAHYQTLSLQNKITLVPLPPSRGLIYDRNGVLLAENISVFSLVYHPQAKIPLSQALADIATILPISDNDLAGFKQALRSHRAFQTIPLKLKLTPKEMAHFAVNAYRFPEFSIKPALIRYYPTGKINAHLLGYVGRMNADDFATVDANNYAATNDIGKIGLEHYFETALHGTVGYQKIEIDAKGQPVRILSVHPPIAGENLYLTVDSQLQKTAYQALKNLRGAVIAIDPQTGEVLAFVSHPAYNPNLFVRGISQKNFDALLQNPNRPLYNRAIRGLYPPGSTIKPFMALALLNAGVTTPDTRIFDPGYFTLPNSTHIYHDWLRTGHGWMNLHDAIAQSCDTYFYHFSHLLGIEPIDQMMTTFGFGQLTHIEMSEELAGDIPSPDYKMRRTGAHWYPGDTIISAIGQGLWQVTLIQLDQAVATLAMHGQGMQPHLLLGIAAPQTQTMIPTPAQPLPPIVLQKPEYWDEAIGGMVGVINDPRGTGYHFGHPPYSVAAKTGTAQVHNLRATDDPNAWLPENERDNSLFIAFAPVDHPIIAVVVAVENDAEAPRVARAVMDQYLLTEGHDVKPS